MVQVRNTSNKMVMAGERYLAPGETRVVTEGQAAQLAESVERIPADPTREVLAENAPAVKEDALTEIFGITPAIAEAMVAMGVDSFAKLAAAPPVQLVDEIAGCNLISVKQWQNKAYNLAVEKGDLEAEAPPINKAQPVSKPKPVSKPRPANEEKI